jgi:hypothetical protein
VSGLPAKTVNATGGANFRQTNCASWREILDVGNWDRSVMTNVPGESGDPASKHYSDLLGDWAAGKYHPMPFSRKAVEAATEERQLERQFSPWVASGPSTLQTYPFCNADFAAWLYHARSVEVLRPDRRQLETGWWTKSGVTVHWHRHA